MTEKIILIKQMIQAAQDRQKSYADRKRKPMEFEVGDWVMLKVRWNSRRVMSSPRNAKIRLNKDTDISSQTGLRHPLQGLKL
uniref:Reverse transcriptase domain-containing protein n=1 Tax=Tanacetum cinerariifolium TaxID=118510 RepID=A0A699UDL0_TANCI|nr:reverse transcriptase domain-containing protein [Tanacetum cinerariifolium]